MSRLDVWDCQKRSEAIGLTGDASRTTPGLLVAVGENSSHPGVVREESRHREKKGGSQVTARAGERERRRYSM